MNFLKKDYILLSPILFIYAFVLLNFGTSNLTGDEGRYIKFAENIIKGYFAEPNLQKGFLWVGPGYPLFLVPFKLFQYMLVF